MHALSPLSLGVAKLPASCHYHVILSSTIPSLLPTVTEVNDVWLLKGITVFRMCSNPPLREDVSGSESGRHISNHVCIKQMYQGLLQGRPIDNYPPVQMQREGNFWVSFMSSNQVEVVRIITS